MNRRQFLVAGAAVTSGLLRGNAPKALNANLGLWDAPTAPRGGLVDRDPDRTGRVVDVNDRTVRVEVTAGAEREPFSLLAIRREYPTGDVLGRARSDPIRPRTGTGSTHVEIEVPRGDDDGGRDREHADDRDRGPWFSEIYTLRGSVNARRRYLCESAPYAWRRSGDAARRVDRVAAAKPATSDETFERRRDGNDYVLTYRFRDRYGDAWTFQQRLRRSTHDAAVAADRGYVRTFDESRTSPVARDLASRIFATAERNDERAQEPEGGSNSDGDQGSDRGGDHEPDRERIREPDRERIREPDGVGEDVANDGDGAAAGRGAASALDDGDRFDLLVRFVQSFDYAFDLQTTGSVDYHRTVEETLVDGVGDCKDRTYLLAGLLGTAFDCDTTLLFQSGHVLLGVDPESVPDLPYEYRPIVVGERTYVPIEPSLHVRVGRYPDRPFLAAYGDGQWLHTDVRAMVGGVDRAVDSWMSYVE